MKVRIGIDNGVSGGIVALDGQRRPVLACPMPTFGKRKQLDRPRVLEVLRSLRSCGDDVEAVLEYAQAFPGQGVATSFRYGVSYGAMGMALDAAGIPFDVRKPQSWQKELGLTLGPEWKGRAVAERRAEMKRRAIVYVTEHVPDLDMMPGLYRVPHTGMADAACMACTLLLPPAHPPLFT